RQRRTTRPGLATRESGRRVKRASCASATTSPEIGWPACRAGTYTTHSASTSGWTGRNSLAVRCARRTSAIPRPPMIVLVASLLLVGPVQVSMLPELEEAAVGGRGSSSRATTPCKKKIG
ncbi:unnamed protein product, partial [Ectocarpus sp. 13 AM-2016]